MTKFNEIEAYTLHIVFSVDGWTTAQPMIEENDRVLLVQDAAYLAQKDLSSLNHSTHNLYVRCLDARARNIKSDPHIEVIDDEQWLELTEHATNVISW